MQNFRNFPAEGAELKIVERIDSQMLSSSSDYTSKDCPIDSSFL